MAYNGPVVFIVSRFERLGSYLSLYYLLCVVFSLSVRFDHIKVKVPCKRESDQKRSIIIQYELLQRDMTNYGHTRHSISNSDQFSTIAPGKATYGLWPHLVADTAYYGIYWSRMTCYRQWWTTLVKNIKLERVSPLQGRIEGPRYSISGCSMYGTLRQDLSNLI